MIKSYYVVDFFGSRDGSTHNWARSLGLVETELSKADIVIFPGSASDTDPTLYGEVKEEGTWCTPASAEWDRKAIEIIRQCIARPRPPVLFGICRGLQILHVAFGGKLIQHVDGHGGNHTVELTNVDGSTWVGNFAAYHHQQIDKDTMTKAGGAVIGWDGAHPEAAVYPLAKAFATQFHPEWCGNAKLDAWIMEYASHLQKHDPLKEAV